MYTNNSGKKWLKNFSAKVAETVVETCLCENLPTLGSVSTSIFAVT